MSWRWSSARCPWQPGARELLAELRARRCLRAGDDVVAAVRRRRCSRALPEGSFDVARRGDEVAHGKPHPEPYLRAAELVGLPTAATVAIEDSPTGATSAEAAGCQVLVVPSHVPVAAGERRTLRETLVGLTPADLAALIPAR